MQSNKANVKLHTAIRPQLLAATPTPTGVQIGAWQFATCVFVAGAITDGTFTPSVTHKETVDDNYAACASTDIDGTLAALEANTEQRVGYKGVYNYIAPLITVTGSPGTGGLMAAFVILEGPVRGPAA